ncbi:hypothetical protein PUT24_05625 [Streptomyces sp. SP17KL33]|nr:hypothetical protein [Streptomyces sp. SP17KL33]
MPTVSASGSFPTSGVTQPPRPMAFSPAAIRLPAESEPRRNSVLRAMPFSHVQPNLFTYRL